MGENIASIIVKVHTLAKAWLPNYVQAEEMRHINMMIGEALRENSERNAALLRYREALEKIRDRDVLFDESMSEIAAEALKG